MTSTPSVPTSIPRLTSLTAGGGCACKVPPGELHALLAGLAPRTGHGPEDSDEGSGPSIVRGIGDDAALAALPGGQTLVSTVDFFAPVVDDPYDFGRIAATNALSDVYAMGGTPILALNLLGWPREILPAEIMSEVLRGGADVAASAGCAVAGGHSIQNPEPLYGMAVTGLVDAQRTLRQDAATPGLPLTLTKPIGTGVLTTWHVRTGEVSAAAVEVMTTLNAEASRAAVGAGALAATDVTGFGLLGHLLTMMRASGTSARIDLGAVPVVEGARGRAAEGFISGGTRRNLAWVEPVLDAVGVAEVDLLLLADALTSGGLLVVGEVPGHPVIGEVLPLATNDDGTGDAVIEVRA